jgi:hypothetical protein
MDPEGHEQIRWAIDIPAAFRMIHSQASRFHGERACESPRQRLGDAAGNAGTKQPLQALGLPRGPRPGVGHEQHRPFINVDDKDLVNFRALDIANRT